MWQRTIVPEAKAQSSNVLKKILKKTKKKEKVIRDNPVIIEIDNKTTTLCGVSWVNF